MSFESAKLSEAPHGAGNALDGYFSIKVADDTFGLPVTRVQTIFRIGAVTAAPGGPRDIVGLVNLRGKIVTAVSLRRRLGLRSREAAAAREPGHRHRTPQRSLRAAGRRGRRRADA